MAHDIWWLTFWDWLAQPGVAYMLLILALWAIIAAIAIPGTGIAEGAAGLFLFLAIISLAHLPLRPSGVLLLVGGNLLLLANLKLQHWAAALSGGVFQLIGAASLFTTGFAIISPWIVLPTTLINVLLVSLVQWNKHAPALLDTERLIGATGKAMSPLTPTGVVQVAGELWSAVCNEAAPENTPIRVIAIEGLTLQVEVLTAPQEEPAET